MRSADSGLTRAVRTGSKPVDRASAADRITAYVYGNILVLAALVVLDVHAIDSGGGILVVLGTALSTFIAHLVAHDVGSAIEHPDGFDRAHKSAMVRDSVPILTSGSIPSLILATGYWDWISPESAQIAAAALVIVRIALIGGVVVRLTDEDRPMRALLGGIGLAVLSSLVVLVKVLLTH